MVVVAILRRIAYTLLALFRSVTQRSEENRTMPWRRLIGHIKNTLVAATAEQLQGLRRHRLPLRHVASAKARRRFAL